MKPGKIIAIAIFCSFIGVLFFLVHRKWLVIQLNIGQSETFDRTSTFDASTHKTVRLHYWKNNDWHYETSTLVWHEQNDASNLKLLIKQWLITLGDEHIISSHVNLESAVLGTPGGELYLSFDRSLFDKDSSTKSKWMIIEGLFKTIHAINSTIQSIAFQVHHQPMHDDHIELSHAIPVQEFCS